MGISERRRVSTHSVVVCAGERWIFRGRVVSIPSKIPFFTLCGKRLHSFGHRGGNGIFGRSTVVRCDRIRRVQGIPNCQPLRQFLRLYASLRHYACVCRSVGAQRARRERKHSAHGAAVASHQRGEYVARCYDGGNGNRLRGFKTQRKINFHKIYYGRRREKSVLSDFSVFSHQEDLWINI